eukprot:TRINITY_DN53_c0_g1_i12.p1 TRINITY_DN53_c0_g1~~TRINITY_DN53_c0_g1_i12.p1  ORF type:complete len:1347 (-),score=324.54 TRINITY_DN53_c0_g1_i12:2580-6578(-)
MRAAWGCVAHLVVVPLACCAALLAGAPRLANLRTTGGRVALGTTFVLSLLGSGWCFWRLWFRKTTPATASKGAAPAAQAPFPARPVPTAQKPQATAAVAQRTAVQKQPAQPPAAAPPSSTPKQQQQSAVPTVPAAQRATVPALNLAQAAQQPQPPGVTLTSPTSPSSSSICTVAVSVATACDRCGKALTAGELAVMAAGVWHRACFRCYHCGELLQDTYCLHKGHAHCTHCYEVLNFTTIHVTRSRKSTSVQSLFYSPAAPTSSSPAATDVLRSITPPVAGSESLAPGSKPKFGGSFKCEACGKSVFANELCKVMNTTYHRLCFKCSGCGKPLLPSNYEQYNKKPYCVRCRDNCMILELQAAAKCATPSSLVAVSTPDNSPLQQAPVAAVLPPPESQALPAGGVTLSETQTAPPQEQAPGKLVFLTKGRVKIPRNRSRPHLHLPPPAAAEGDEPVPAAAAGGGHRSVADLRDPALVESGAQDIWAAVEERRERERRKQEEERRREQQRQEEERQRERQRQEEERREQEKRRELSEEERKYEQLEKNRSFVRDKYKEEHSQQYQKLCTSAIKRHVENKSRVRLVKVKGRRYVQVNEIPLEDPLPPDASYILDTGTAIYTLSGPKANRVEAVKCVDTASKIKNKEHNSVLTRQINLGKDDGSSAAAATADSGPDAEVYAATNLLRRFWDALGGKRDFCAPVEDAEAYEKRMNASYLLLRTVSGPNGVGLVDVRECGQVYAPTPSPVSSPAPSPASSPAPGDTSRAVAAAPSSSAAAPRLRRAMLDSSEVYVLCTCTELYVWVGKLCKVANKRNAAQTRAQELQSQSPHREWLQVVKVAEGGEPVLFTEKFCDWPSSIPISGPRDQATDIVQAVSPPVEVFDVHSVLPFFNKARKDELDHLPEKAISDDVTIWLVKEYEREPVRRDVYGHFFSGNAYVLLFTYDNQPGPTGHLSSGKHIVYYWLAAAGKDSSRIERGSAALQAKDVVDAINARSGIVTLARATQNKEPVHFKALFKNRYIIHLGKHDDNLTSLSCPGLYKVCDVPRLPNLLQLPFVPQFLHPRVCCLFHLPSGSFLWCGSHTLSTEQDAALQYVRQQLPNVSVEPASEGSEPENLKQALTVAVQPHQEAAADDAEVGPPPVTPLGDNLCTLLTSGWQPRLFHSHGQQLTEVYDVTQDDLEPTHQMLLDDFSAVFLWAGPRSDPANLRWSLEMCQEYVKAQAMDGDHRSITTPVYYVEANNEPFLFIRVFPTWSPAPQESGDNRLVTVSEALKKYSQTYSYQELLDHDTISGLNRARLEDYLLKQDFEAVFKMTREEWEKTPGWKQRKIKKELSLL